MSIAKRLKDEVDANRMKREKADALLSSIHRTTPTSTDANQHSDSNKKPDAPSHERPSD